MRPRNKFITSYSATNVSLKLKVPVHLQFTILESDILQYFCADDLKEIQNDKMTINEYIYDLRVVTLFLLNKHHN